MKTFYACIDIQLTTPLSIQHMAIRERAKKIDGKIGFYGSEEAKTLVSQGFIREKVRRSKGTLDGIMFFSLHQFRYGPEMNWGLLKEILESPMEVHFAREGLSFDTVEALYERFPFLLSVDYTLRRDKDPRWLSFIANYERA